jgi:hypothetical protein
MIFFSHGTLPPIKEIIAAIVNFRYACCVELFILGD